MYPAGYFPRAPPSSSSSSPSPSPSIPPRRGLVRLGTPRYASVRLGTPWPNSLGQVSVRVSYLEIYNERIRDLLAPTSQSRAQAQSHASAHGRRGPASAGSNVGSKLGSNSVSATGVSAPTLAVREDRAQGVFVDGLTTTAVRSSDEVLAALQAGLRSRAVAAAKFNAESSRSHTVFELHVEQVYTVEGVEAQARSKISLVDLAGSERSYRLGAAGAGVGVELAEGHHPAESNRQLIAHSTHSINNSLTVMGRVIEALADLGGGSRGGSGGTPRGDSAGKHGGKTFNLNVPFHESVLTRYMQDALSGNSRTTMIATVSPAGERVRARARVMRVVGVVRVVTGESGERVRG